MSEKSSRRDFLRGRTAARAARDAIDHALPDTQDEPAALAREIPYLVQITHRAMACDFEISLNAGQYVSGKSVGLLAMDRVDELEDCLSVFRDESAICRLNRAAADGPVAVESTVFEILATAEQLSRETEGALDITASPLWRAWGFARRQGKLPSADEIEAALRRVGYGHIHLDREQRTVRFDTRGIEVSLGSIGKGYALDQAARLLETEGIVDFLFHGGQSSVLARGSRADGQGAADEDGCRGWTVGIGHPLRPGRRLATLRLRNRALATSGTAAQFFRHQGRRYGHILDPRTGWPAEGVLSATVIAPTAALADGLSTAFYVLGPDRAGEYCAPRPELAAVLVLPTKRAPGFELLTIGLEEDALTRESDW